MNERGVTLVELVLAIAIGGILAATTPSLILHGVRSMVILPRSQMTAQAAVEILQGAVEGSVSSVSGQRVPGLREAAGQSQSPPEPAVWLAEASRIGFLVPRDPYTALDNTYVVLRLDQQAIRRAVYPSRACPPPAALEETMPYHAAGVVRVITSGSRPLFRYYDQGGAPVAPPGCTAGSAIRRVDIAFAAESGPGSGAEADARADVLSAVAIRFP